MQHVNYQNKKHLALLLDPDKIEKKSLQAYLTSANAQPDFLLLGGSLLTEGTLSELVTFLKTCTQLPLIIFPGNYLQIDSRADGFWLLSLLSGRNPEFLIGQHVVAAPVLKKSQLHIVPVAYLLIEGGAPTSVSYISHTQPIPAHKPELAACTALAGEQLGMHLVYLEAGSGALKPVGVDTIRAVKQTVNLSIVVGGGIRTAEAAHQAWSAGADVVVVGSAAESRLKVIEEMAQMRDRINRESLLNKV
ncbi:MAG: geranylgeranylglyceryl/heptaprenylglyceryl phosphate synthase [Cytophagales bacterium]|nr:MAG: geranylgeranylglyceryl/heptaprenylglyceryl phosphate synthase [Cytophagales bacterium]TAF59837.1 MAG: geranylgeranylglyceryl/heptaprenylglyceryl phosphate synthase [Cytophagales bacterium]